MSRGAGSRMRKVNELLREVIAEELADLKDPRMGFVTITGVDTAPDLRHAVVYYSVLGSEEDERSTATALGSARSRLQRAVGTQTRLKFTPVLEFSVDPAIRQGERITEILRGLDSEPPEEAP
jgi:ribosome-binding factor A